MGFPERAVEACYKAMESGTVTGRHVQDVLRCKVVDVAPLAPFLRSDDSMVRTMAAKIIGEKGGPSDALLDAALHEEETQVLVEMLKQLGKHRDAVGSLANLINSEDVLIRDVAVDMFRRAGKQEFLFPMIFDKDDKVVERVKRYLNEQEGQSR